MTHHDSAPITRRRKIAIAAGVLFTIGLAGAMLESCEAPADDPVVTSTQETTTQEATTQEAVPIPDPAPVTPEEEPVMVTYDGPWPNGNQLSAFEKASDHRVEAHDVAYHVKDDLNGERVVADKANWRIIAHCDQLDGNKIVVGVVKQDEYPGLIAAGGGTMVADNTLAYLLPCK